MKKVLIVDSDELTRRSISVACDWAALGCSVIAEASDAGRALELAGELEPALIISEINVPGIDGLEMLRLLRRSGSGAQVIFLTARDEFKYIQSALRLGAADYLLKPFDPGELEQAVLRLLEPRSCAPLPCLPELPEPESGLGSKYVAEAVEYINLHYSKPGTGVSSTAKYLGMSEGHLSRLFKRETGCTLHAYITGCRIRRATELLHDCRAKIYEVAEQVGYRDIAYFSAAFKRFMGMSPSEYQEKCR